jgi:hypothetical protein
MAHDEGKNSTMTRVTLRGKILCVVREKQDTHRNTFGGYLAVPRAIAQVFADFFELQERLAAAEKELTKFKKFM